MNYHLLARLLYALLTSLFEAPLLIPSVEYGSNCPLPKDAAAILIVNNNGPKHTKPKRKIAVNALQISPLALIFASDDGLQNQFVFKLFYCSDVLNKRLLHWRKPACNFGICLDGFRP